MFLRLQTFEDFTNLQTTPVHLFVFTHPQNSSEVKFQNRSERSVKLLSGLMSTSALSGSVPT